MFNTDVYNYIDVLGKASDAAWLRNEALSNNIANVDTPRYKRQDVDFETKLDRAMSRMRYKSMDQKVEESLKRDLSATTYTDHGGYSYRIDRNNVDIDTEEIAVAGNQIKYNALQASLNQEFSNLKMVMK